MFPVLTGLCYVLFEGFWVSVSRIPARLSPAFWGHHNRRRFSSDSDRTSSILLTLIDSF